MRGIYVSPWLNNTYLHLSRMFPSVVLGCITCPEFKWKTREINKASLQCKEQQNDPAFQQALIMFYYLKLNNYIFFLIT